VLEQTSVDDELVAPARQVIGLLRVEMLGPTLIEWATPEQSGDSCRRFSPRRDLVPGLLRAGTPAPTWRRSGRVPSSTATTSCERPEGLDVYGHLADWMFCLSGRIPEAPRRGISTS